MARIWLFLFLICAALPAYAAGDDAAERLKQIESNLKNKEQAAEKAAAALADAKRDLGDFQKKLRDAAARENGLQDRLDDLTEELADLRADAADARADLDRAAKTETGALGLLVRLAAWPPAAWLLHDGATLDQERRMILLRGATRGLEDRTETLRQGLRRTDRSEARLAAKQEELIAAKADLQDKQDELNRMIAARRELAASHQADHAALTRETAKLSAEAADLHSLLDRMTRRGKNQKSGKKPGKPQPGMLLPVAGEVTQAYGARDRFGISSRGLKLAAKPGGRIVAPLAGKIVFAGPFKGYGDILIVQHAGDYHSLLAGFGRIDVTLGQSVLAGEPVGTAAPRGEVYFEFRRDGDPVDPMSVDPKLADPKSARLKSKKAP